MAKLPAAEWRVEPLSAVHDRSEFSCGVESLDRYLLTQVGQEARRRVATAFVLLREGSSRVAGYYTLSATSIDAASLPPELAKRLPRYPAMPATLLGRLAVDTRFRGMKLGNLLLANAMMRSFENTGAIGSVAVVVDAIDEGAAGFYERFGMVRFPTEPLRLFMTMDTIKRMQGM